jgi:hypothetical protein
MSHWTLFIIIGNAFGAGMNLSWFVATGMKRSGFMAVISTAAVIGLLLGAV